MKILILVILMGTLLVGCAHRPSGYWTKDGFDPAQWEKDRYECDHNAQVASQYWNPRQGLLTATVAYDYNFKNCIRSKSYYWVENPR